MGTMVLRSAVSLLLLVLLHSAALAEKRIALLIGNKDYKPGVGGCMLKRSLSILLAFLLGLLSGTELGNAQGRRVALVIGNSKYVHAPALRNPANDASDIAVVLRDLGFEVIPGLDLTYEGMRNAVMAFSQRMEGADVGLLFYAGHGIQISDRNYLIPTDASLQHPRDV